ncbi:MAG: ribosome maturation factor RimM [Treponema sp.]|jgi:16S rRNA processing protein RimM|nr:ribosome maturation factor RimM [Treponema sp.]
MTETFVAALVGAPFGLKGFVKVRSLSGEIEHLLKLGSVSLRREGREEFWKIEEAVPAPPGPLVLMKFRGIDSPEAAKTLGGAEILVKREDAASLKPGEYYIEDLKGLTVYAAPEGEILGVITGVIEGGGGNLAEVRLNGGERRLIPFRNEFFGEIDLPGRRAELLCRWILE